jgi:hypothetical protein
LNQQIGIYIDNIKPTSPSRILIFNAEALKPEFWNKELNYDFLQKALNNHIIFSGFVTQSGDYPFIFNNEKYTLSVKKVYWYLFGSDYMTVVVSQ